MNTNIQLLAAVLIIACVIFSGESASGQIGYTIEQVTAGSVNHRAPSINNLGEIVWMEDTGQGRQVFSSTRGQLTSPSGNYSEALYPALADNGSFICFRPGSLPCTGSGYLLLYPGESTVDNCSRNTLSGAHRDPIPQSGIASDGRKFWGREFYGSPSSLQSRRFFVEGTEVSLPSTLVNWQNPSINRHREYVYDASGQVYSSTRGPISSGIQPAINDSGDVAFAVGAEVRVLLTGGAVRVVGAGTDPGINQQGTVVFERQVSGIYHIFRATPAPDLVATALAWNSTQGGLNFQYEVVGPGIPAGTTAKLFWASGTTTATILSLTPIFTHSIPSGTSGGSSPIHVGAGAFATPPGGATYVLLVLDHEAAIQEADESNNSRAISLCPISGLTLTHMDEPPYDESFLALELRQALACFRSAVAALGGSVTPNSGYRPTEYQAHLYELRTKFVELSQVNGIIAYVDGRRPQLASTPGTIACQSVIDSVNSEIRQHLLVARTDGTPAVSAPGNSTHELGRAVDLTVSGLPSNVSVDRVARNCGLYRPYVANDPVHYELTGETPRRQLTFTGNSPINVLVSDPAGRKVGFDASLGTSVNQIGAYAKYSGPGSTPQVIDILPNEVLPGNYSVSGVGTGNGAYTVRVQIAGEDGSGPVVDRLLATGNAVAGQPLPAITPIDCVMSSVTIQIETLGNNFVLLAPPWATNAAVESSTNLVPGSWTQIHQPLNPTNGLVLTNLMSEPRFFRLRIP